MIELLRSSCSLNLYLTSRGLSVCQMPCLALLTSIGALIPGFPWFLSSKYSWVRVSCDLLMQLVIAVFVRLVGCDVMVP